MGTLQGKKSKYYSFYETLGAKDQSYSWQEVNTPKHYGYCHLQNAVRNYVDNL